MTSFRVHYCHADHPGEPQHTIVDAADPDEARRLVQKTRGGCRLIFHKVKVDRSSDQG